jgi:hypothetical protein
MYSCLLISKKAVPLQREIRHKYMINMCLNKAKK